MNPEDKDDIPQIFLNEKGNLNQKALLYFLVPLIVGTIARQDQKM
jgi:hypothetical protein